MAQLIVVGFKKDMYRASEVLNQLQGMDDDWVVDLHDAVAAYRDYNGKLRVDQSYQMTAGEGAGWGGLMGSLIGLTLAIPFTGGASAIPVAGALAAGAAAGGALGAGAGALDAKWWKDEFAYPTISSSRSGRWSNRAIRRSMRFFAAPIPTLCRIISAVMAAPFSAQP